MRSVFSFTVGLAALAAAGFACSDEDSPSAEGAGDLPDSAPADAAPFVRGPRDEGPEIETARARLLSGGVVSCAISAAGELRCWGRGHPPTVFGGGETWKDVAVANEPERGSCAVRADGSLWCVDVEGWQLRPVASPPLTQVAVAAQDFCAVAVNGQLHCWGADNRLGQLGTGDLEPRAEPTRIGEGDDWRLVALGDVHACALSKRGRIACWGGGGAGQLGDGELVTEAYFVARPNFVQGGGFVDLDARGLATCAVRADGALLCWGTQPTIGLASSLPLRLGADHSWRAVRLSPHHVCALERDRQVYCWGRNDFSQLGAPPGADVQAPRPVAGIADVVDIAVSASSSCARNATGVYCWGSNLRGDLGTLPAPQRTPVPIGDPAAWTAVSVGDKTACGIRKNGELACWGLLDTLHPSRTRSNVPVPFAKSGWTAIEVDRGLACGTTGLALRCWGAALGGPNQIDARYNDNAAAVSVGFDHRCFLSAGGNIYCWGASDRDQAGGLSGPMVLTPTPIGVPGPWSAIAAARYLQCALAGDGRLSCSGARLPWRVVDAATTWSFIGGQSSVGLIYAIKAGQLHRFDGSALAPDGEPFLDWRSFSGGAGHSCGIRTNGTLWCRGENSDGQLGDGTDTTRTSFVQVGAATDWTSVFTGSSSTCGLRSDGTLYCWGGNDEGQIGDGTGLSDVPLVVP